MRAAGASVALLAALAVAAPAPAGDDSRQEVDYTMSEKRLGRSTAERFLVDYRDPADPAGKPPAVREVVTTLPRGARYDVTVPGSCTASDAELTSQGAQACPPQSAIGGGVVTVDTGLPGPGRFVTADVELFNNADDPDGEFIYLNTVRDSGARTVIRADISRRARVTVAGMLPGTPPDGGAIDTVDITVAEVSREVEGELRHYITTPRRRCPRSGHWNMRVRFTYADAVSQMVKSPSPCKRKGRR